MHNCGVPSEYSSISPYHARYRNWDKISTNQYLPKCPCRQMNDCDCNSYCKISQYVDHCLKKNLVSPADSDCCNRNRCVCKKRRETFRNCSTDCELMRLRRTLKRECCCRCLADEADDELCDCPRLIRCLGAQDLAEEQSCCVCGCEQASCNTSGPCGIPPLCRNPPACMKVPTCVNSSNPPSCKSPPLCPNPPICSKPRACIKNPVYSNQTTCTTPPSCRSQSTRRKESHCMDESPCTSPTACMSPSSSCMSPTSRMSPTTSSTTTSQPCQPYVSQSTGNCNKNSVTPSQTDKSKPCHKVPKKCRIAPSCENDSNTSNGQSYSSETCDQENSRQVTTCDMCSCPVYEEFIVVDDENVEEPSFICVPNYITMSSPTRSYNSVDVYDDYSEPTSQFSFIREGGRSLNYPSEEQTKYHNLRGEWGSRKITPMPSEIPMVNQQAMGGQTLQNQQTMGNQMSIASQSTMGSQIPLTNQQSMGSQMQNINTQQSFNIPNISDGNQNFITNDEQNLQGDQVQEEGEASVSELPMQQERMSRETQSLMNQSAEEYYHEAISEPVLAEEQDNQPDSQFQTQQAYHLQGSMPITLQGGSDFPTPAQEQFTAYISQPRNVMFCRPGIQVCTTQRRASVERIQNPTPIVKLCKSMPSKNECFSPQTPICKKSSIKRKRSFQVCELDSVEECPDLEEMA